MTWLAWRQLRAPAAAAALVVLGVVVALAVTGPHLLNVYDTVVAPCAAHGDCPRSPLTSKGSTHNCASCVRG